MEEQAPTNLEDHLRLCVAAFEESEQMTTDSRASSERCRDYYNGQQYTAAELAALRRRGQAPVWDNHIRRKVDSACGLERRTRTDPKAFPRTPQDEQIAGAATDALRYVADANRFPNVRSEVFNDILVEGTGAAEIIIEQTPNDIKVVAKRIPWDRFFYDGHSRALNFEDWTYCGIVIWSDASALERKYPDRKAAIQGSFEVGAWGDTYQDRPRTIWCDSKRKRVREVQIHYSYDGDWWVATFTKGGFLVDPVKSPYLDKDGNTACSIIARSGYIDRDNNRYGHCKDLLPLQDEINKRRSKALHILSQRQTYGNKIAISDVKKAKTELAKPDGHVEVNEGAQFGKDFGVIPTGDMAQGQVLMYEQALGSMGSQGANNALQGKDDRTQSGVALQTRIQTGAIELEPQTDGLREWTHQCYEAMWMRVRQFWTGEKWVRVTDDDRNIRWVGLNKPVTLEERLQQMEPQQAQQIAMQLQLAPGDPRLQTVVGVDNDVSGLDVDIIIDESPDIATLQSEQFTELARLAGTPQGAQQIPFVEILKLSSLRNKDQVIAAIEKAQEQAQQAQGQAQQQAQQLGQATAVADIRNKNADTQKKLADAHATEVSAQLDTFQALNPPQPATPIQ